MKTAKLIDSFLAEHRELAGSRDGYPALALSLNQCRELAEYAGGLHTQIEALERYILYKSPICKDAPVPMSDYCDMALFCDECKARMKAVKKIEDIKNL